MRLWQIAAVVLVGVGYGALFPGRLTFAFGHATLYVLLPALLFEAAWNLNYRAMKRWWVPIATLAIPGVALTAVIIAGALSIVRVPFGVALLTGAILSATDPIAVVAVFRRMRVPLTLSTIVECESLFNDAAAVLLYRAVVLAVTLGVLSWSDAARIAWESLAGAAGGIILGLVTALAAARLLRNRRGDAVQIAATLLCAYATYFAAEWLHASGILATITCGIALRYYERSWITLTIAEEVNRFWDVAMLFANVLVFFLVGAALDISAVVRQPAFVIATLAGVTLARAAVAGLLLPTGFPREWLDVVRVAGMRGALSLALALALPANVPYRDAIVGATFAVALATIISSALTVPPVVARAARNARAVLR